MGSEGSMQMEFKQSRSIEEAGCCMLYLKEPPAPNLSQKHHGGAKGLKHFSAASGKFLS